MTTVDSARVDPVHNGPEDAWSVLYDEMVALAKRVHRVLIERAARVRGADPTGRRAALFEQAEAIIDAAAGVDPTDQHQILNTRAALGLRLDTLLLMEYPDDETCDPARLRRGHRPHPQ